MPVSSSDHSSIRAPSRLETATNTHSATEMILGFEACRACNWQNIFWESDGEPQPQLIASLSINRSFICPACRGDGTGRRMSFSALPYSAIFDEPLEIPVEEELLDSTPELTTRQLRLQDHLRAVCHWLGPWEQNTQEWLAAATFCWCLLSLGTLVFAGTSACLEMLQLYGYVWIVILAHHVLVSAVVVIIAYATSDRKTAKKLLAIMWRKQAEKPLFKHIAGRFGHRWYIYTYLRESNHGGTYTRRQAWRASSRLAVRDRLGI